MTINIKPYMVLDMDNRIGALLADIDGIDVDTGAILRSSRGNRKDGRPRKYWAKYNNIIVHFTAHTVQEACQEANDKLNALIGPPAPEVEP